MAPDPPAVRYWIGGRYWRLHDGGTTSRPLYLLSETYSANGHPELIATSEPLETKTDGAGNAKKGDNSDN